MRELRCSPSKRVVKEYPIYVGTNILAENLPRLIKSFAADQIVIITDSIVKELYGEMILNLLNPVVPASIISMPAGEEHKTPETYLDLCCQVLEKQVTKKSFILVLGGGVPGNVGGFVASTVMRGLRFAHVPTTVISQADSTTGGKQGVNTKLGKNLLGIFNDPEFVIVDTQFLKTLPAREIRGGIAECIKHALCQDQDFVNYLLGHVNPQAEYSHEVLCEIIFRTLDAKLDVLRYDPKEINEGKVLVYGHTAGHAAETLAAGKLTHGEAISMGMMFVAHAAKELGFASEETVQAHRKILLQAGLPISFPEYVTEDLLVEQLQYDKKYSTEMELILLESIGTLQAKEGRIGHGVSTDFVRNIFRKYFLSHSNSSSGSYSNNNNNNNNNTTEELATQEGEEVSKEAQSLSDQNTKSQDLKVDFCTSNP